MLTIILTAVGLICLVIVVYWAYSMYMASQAMNIISQAVAGAAAAAAAGTPAQQSALEKYTNLTKACANPPTSDAGLTDNNAGPDTCAQTCEQKNASGTPCKGFAYDNSQKKCFFTASQYDPTACTFANGYVHYQRN